MSRAWESAINADYVSRIQSIVQQWRAGDLNDREAIEEVEHETDILG